MSTARTSNDAKKAGGYLKEKFTIGISRVTGDEVSRSIMKTTSHMLKAPKDKHLQRLLSATHGHCSADSLEKHKDMAAYIVEELEKRSHTHNWIVVLKTMITFHHILIDGSLSANRVMQRNRGLFCMRAVKDLADSPDGAAQKNFIEHYIRYLEERNISQARIDVDPRIESDEYLTVLKSMSNEVLAKAMTQLIQQLECIANIEFREVVVDNFATLDAYNLLIADGTRLYGMLANRMLYILERFDEMEIMAKQTWLSVYRRYAKCVHSLALLFQRLLSANRHFSSPIPKINEFPADVLMKLEQDVEYSSIPKETIHFEDDEPEAAPAAHQAPEIEQPANTDLFEEISDEPSTTTTDQKKPAADLDDWFAPAPAPAPATSTTRETKKASADIDDIFGPPSSSSAHSAPQQHQYQHNGYQAKAQTNMFNDEPAVESRPKSAPKEFDPFGASPPTSSWQEEKKSQPARASNPMDDLFGPPSATATKTTAPAYSNSAW